MKRIIDDPLMSGTRGLLVFLFWLFVVVGILALALAPVMALNADMIAAEMASKGIEDPIRPGILALVIFIGGILLAVLAWFIRLLRGIVWSVADGDPFVRENAARLTRMGWLAIAIAILSTCIGAAASFVVGTHGSWDIDGGSLILALSLFILARVFRHGAAMRAELEGTV